MVLKKISLNVKGLNSPSKRSMLGRDVVKSQADIVCIQETHLLNIDTNRLSHKKFPTIFHSTADSKKAGVAIMIKDSVAFHLETSFIDDSGRYVILHCTLNSRKFTILLLYAPNTYQLTFIKKKIT